MKNIKLYIILSIVALLALMGVGSYNGLVSKSQQVDSSWAQVTVQYQRRLDLIPNLVATVKGAANFEKSTLTDVINARAKATAVTVDASTINNPQQFAQYQKAQGEISSALSRLMVVQEKYPDLKSNQQFQSLMFEISGTENRISISRRDYNNEVQAYNTSIKTFPTNLVANNFGFTVKQYFQADEKASVAPTINFN